jgi:hypothetical protein
MRVLRRATYAMVVFVCDGAEVASWPLAGRGSPDLAVVDQLARAQLVARHLGGSLRLRGACGELLELLELTGVGEVVGALPVEVRGEPEGREQAVVDEVVVPDDPAV